MNAAGKITSTPDTNGNHSLKCPKCKANFLSIITKEDTTGVVNNVTCVHCGHSKAPLAYIYEANKKAADKIALNHAEKELQKMFKGSFENSRNIKFK